MVKSWSRGPRSPSQEPGPTPLVACLGIDLFPFRLETGNDLPDVYAPVLLASNFPSPSPVYAYLDHNIVINAEVSALLLIIYHP